MKVCVLDGMNISLRQTKSQRTSRNGKTRSKYTLIWRNSHFTCGFTMLCWRQRKLIKSRTEVSIVFGCTKRSGGKFNWCDMQAKTFARLYFEDACARMTHLVHDVSAGNYIHTVSYSRVCLPQCIPKIICYLLNGLCLPCFEFLSS